MPELAFATQAYEGRDKGLPALQLENLYVEEGQDEGLDEVHLVQVPGKSEITVNGGGVTGAGRGLWRVKGGPTSDLIAVHGATVSTIDSGWNRATIGTITLSSRPVRVTASPEHVAVVDDPSLYIYDGSSFAQVSDPDLGAVTDVAYSSGYWLTIRDGELKVSAFGDPTDWSSLDFVGVGKWPDDCVGLLEDGDDILVFGEEALEVFPPSGDGNAPFYARPGSRVNVGCGSRDSIVFADGRPFWLARERDAGLPYFAEGAGRRISTYAIDDALAAMPLADRSRIKGSSHSLGGHTFVQWDLPGVGSFAWDVATRRWHRRRQFGETLERAMAYEEAFGVLVAQGRDGGLFRLDPSVFVDGDASLRWLFTANAPLGEERVRCKTLRVGLTTGETLLPGTEPQVLMRYSDDRGATWSTQRSASMGAMGERKVRVRWKKLGQMIPPGRVFEITSNAAARVTPYNVVMNGAY